MPAQTPQASQTSQTSLSITCDADCTWNVDGNQHGALKKGEEAKVKVLFGAHNIEATSPDGTQWKQTLELKQPDLTRVRIGFAPTSSDANSGEGAPLPIQEGVPPDQSAGGIPTFYAQARQVLVEAEVWGKGHGKSAKAASMASIKDDPAMRAHKSMIIGLIPPPASGLTVADFHVLDNGVEQPINYFKETDFQAADNSKQWRFVPTVPGTWGTLLSFDNLELPSATYLIGYIPSGPESAECHTIQIVVPSRDVQISHDYYCLSDHPYSRLAGFSQSAKLSARMREFANSSSRGSITVSAGSFTFWSSGVLSLLSEDAVAGASQLPSGEFTYAIEVHDSTAPATVHIALNFDSPVSRWDYPCSNNRPAVHILGIAYKITGEIAGQFSDQFSCAAVPIPLQHAERYLAGWIAVPSRFDTQLELRPGDYNLRVVVTNGHNFGRALVPLKVEPLENQRLTVSDVVVGGVVRDARWVAREAASVAPAPVVPSPLVSKNLQFFPDPDTPARLRKGNPLFLYFEIYQPSENMGQTVYYSMRVMDSKTGSVLMNTGPMSAANWMMPGNAVIPIGVKLDTGGFPKGTYRLEVQASGAQEKATEWRRVAFQID